MVFNVVILSPHGYFGQANVLGLPDTGGQVVYILDQVRALENEMLLRIQKQGLDFKPRILIVSVISRVRFFLFDKVALLLVVFIFYSVEIKLKFLCWFEGYEVNTRCKGDNMQPATRKSQWY